MIDRYYNKIKKIITSCNTKQQLKNSIDLVTRYYDQFRYSNPEGVKYRAGKLMGILEYKRDLILKQCDN